MMRRANAATVAVKISQPRVAKRGKTPELLLAEKGVHFIRSLLLFGDSMTLWRKVPKQAISGYLELDGYGVYAASKFREIRAGLKPKREVTCGLRD